MRKSIVVSIILFLAHLSYALNFSIAPTQFQVDLDKVETQEAYIINNTAQPLRIKVYVDIAEGYEKNNLNSNIVVFPKIVSIKPGGKQVIRFRVKPKDGMTAGKYKSLLVFRESPNELKEVDRSGEKGVTTEFKFLTEVAVGVMGIKK